MLHINCPGHHRFTITLLILALTFPTTLFAKVIVVNGSIQDAVDEASPGDVIFVPPGLYSRTSGNACLDDDKEALVCVDKDDITIRGSKAAIIDATGFDIGILVGPRRRPPDCPQALVSNFTLQGLTIQNAEDTGVRLVGVEGFSLTDSVYLDNEEYGPFPVCSSDGVIARNYAEGHEDAAIYVGNDDGIVVAHNVVKKSAIGIEVENSIDSDVHHNLLTDNTIGVLVVVLPGLPIPLTEDVQITHNVILRNNFPNPVPVDSGDVVGLIPTGSGILNVGGDGVMIEKNTIVGNDSFGIALLGNPFADLDPRIDPVVDDNEVRKNVVLNNSSNPDPERALTPGADIVFVPDVVNPENTGLNNCFANNVFRTDFPEGVVSKLSCIPTPSSPPR